jgi:hypothetical protein
VLGASWPAAGMIVGGRLYEQATLAPRTSEIDGGSSLIPTPTVKGNYNKAGLSKASGATCGTNQGGGAGRVGSARPSLETMARKNLWPTPTARDWKSGSMGTQGNSRPLSEQVGGSLNPEFCEWLMAFPIAWTACDALVTPWYRRRRGKRFKFSQE